jgi:hypothetical protein
VLEAAYPGSTHPPGALNPSSQHPSLNPNNQFPPQNPRAWHDKGRGPSRLYECRAADAVGIAWAYVHSFCPNQMLLYDLAGVLVSKAQQLHAADVSRLLWAYATAKVRRVLQPLWAVRQYTKSLVGCSDGALDSRGWVVAGLA